MDFWQSSSNVMVGAASAKAVSSSTGGPFLGVHDDLSIIVVSANHEVERHGHGVDGQELWLFLGFDVQYRNFHGESLRHVLHNLEAVWDARGVL